MKIDKKEMLTAVFVSCLVLSNILSVKLIGVGAFVVPSGIVCYSITFLISDVIGEIYGKQQAKKTVVYGLICQVICSILIVLAVALPSQNSEVGKAMDEMLKFNVWFTTAGLTAYVISQTADVVVFHGIREKLIKKGAKHRWIWNNVSTFASQAIDTVVFAVIAFGIGMGLKPVTLLQMMATQFAVKCLIAIIDTPIFYFLTRRTKHDKSKDNQGG